VSEITDSRGWVISEGGWFLICVSYSCSFGLVLIQFNGSSKKSKILIRIIHSDKMTDHQTKMHEHMCRCVDVHSFPFVFVHSTPYIRTFAEELLK